MEYDLKNRLLIFKGKYKIAWCKIKVNLPYPIDYYCLRSYLFNYYIVCTHTERGLHHNLNIFHATYLFVYQDVYPLLRITSVFHFMYLYVCIYVYLKQHFAFIFNILYLLQILCIVYTFLIKLQRISIFA